MKRFNIMTAKSYSKADGSQGTKWVKLGSVVMKDDGKLFGDLDSIPLGSWFDGSIQLFEADQQQQSNNNQPQQNSYQNNNNGYGNSQPQQQQQNNYGNHQGQ